MYGDTHVEPARLFDPTREAPPADAIDVYFNTPLSLSLLGDAFAHQGLQRELDKLLTLYISLAAGVITTLQRQGGYVDAERPGGQPEPARLSLAAMAHNSVPGEPTMRLHLHVYVGRTATALDGGRIGQVDRLQLEEAADLAWSSYLVDLMKQSDAVLGAIWGPVPEKMGTEYEIVDPPLMEHVPGHVLGRCPGDFGPREQLMADAAWRADRAEAARQIAQESRRTG